MKGIIILLILLHFLFFTTAQNIKDVEVEYTSVKLPLLPLSLPVKHYHVTMLAPYEEKNRQLLSKYEADKQTAASNYEKDMKQYEKDLKEAEAKYNADMEEYRKKSVGKKVVEKTLLNENSKPVKQLPSKPYPVTVQAPALQTVYDLPVLADTYIKLENFTNSPENAVAIIVTLYGYDYTNPVILSESAAGVRFGTNGAAPAQTSSSYTEYSYRHPMAVKVLTPDGKEILNITPQQLNAYKINRSANVQALNSELLIKSTEEKALQEGLQTINKLVNDKFGMLKEKRTATLYYVKKDEAYADLLTAFNEASSALKILADDSSAAKPRLRDAAAIWTAALKESNLSDKKARINKDVTLAVCFNLLETSLALGDYSGGTTTLQKMNSIELSNKDRSKKNQFEAEMSDLKKRLSLN